MENHKGCKEITVLENIIKNVKTSNLFNEIEQLIDELIETIGKIRQNRETNASAVKGQNILVESEIRELRRKIDKHLDKLQEGLMMELTEAEKQVTEDTRELLVTSDEKQKELTEYQTNVVNIKNMHQTYLQTLLAVKQIEKDVETQDTCLQSIVNSDSLNQTKLSYKMDSGLKTITTSFQKFGEVIIK
jgi:vacuolar-type H+-ATPase subunit I/STV1